MKALRHLIVRALTKLLPLQALRNLYRHYFTVMAWLRYGDKEFPRIVSIEINTHCNRACSYCPNSVLPQPSKLIKHEVFLAIVARLRAIKYNGVVDFIFFSEPTLHPRLAEYIAHVKKEVPWCVTRICTNGDLLTHEKVAVLKGSGLDRIYAMRHNPTPADWVPRMQELSASFPGLFILMDIDQVREEQGLEDFQGLLDVGKPRFARHRDGHAFCNVHSHVAQIAVNGDWQLCCIDYDKSHKFGNLVEEDFLSIWRKQNFSRMRDSLLGGKPILPKCKNCSCFREPQTSTTA